MNDGDGRERSQFLLGMYDQLWSNTGRHLTLVWESVGVLIGAGLVANLVADDAVSVHAAATMFLLLASWVSAHALDSNLWVLRNLHIIGNIEREFLAPQDARSIHPYFLDTPKFRIILGLKLQLQLGLAVWGLTLVSYASGNLRFDRPFHAPAFFPYLAAAGTAWYLLRTHLRQRAAFWSLVKKSSEIGTAVPKNPSSNVGPRRADEELEHPIHLVLERTGRWVGIRKPRLDRSDSPTGVRDGE